MSGDDELCRNLPYLAHHRSLIAALHREIVNVQRTDTVMPPIGAVLCSFELSSLELIWPTMADLTDVGNLMRQNRYMEALNRLIEAQQNLGQLYAILSESGTVVQIIE